MCTSHPSIPIRPEASRPWSGTSMVCVLSFWTYQKSSMSETEPATWTPASHRVPAKVYTIPVRTLAERAAACRIGAHRPLYPAKQTA